MRTGNAAKRSKALPKAVRRAVTAAAAEAKKEILTNTEISAVEELNRLDESTSVEVEDETDAGTEKAEVSPLPAGSESTSTNSKHQHENNAKKERQAKPCTGPKTLINEGVGLASDDGDVARIHAANRKAWPRGQEPIAADATAEDREIAELVRWGIIGNEELQVNHDDFDEEEVCPYTLRFLEARKKGRKESNRRRQGIQDAEPIPWDTESDWWYLDDEAYARLLSDEGTELVDWSEASSFVHVE